MSLLHSEQFKALLASERVRRVSDDRGPWVGTFTKKRLHFLDPSPDEIDITDIAHALSQVVRFNGHMQRFYTVAQHSVMLSKICDTHLAKTFLLHDAPEAYMGDMATPLKVLLPNYEVIENNLCRAIFETFDVNYELMDEIHELDYRACVTEAELMLPGGASGWGRQAEPLGISIIPVPPHIAEIQFLNRFLELFGESYVH